MLPLRSDNHVGLARREVAINPVSYPSRLGGLIAGLVLTVTTVFESGYFY